VGLDRIGVDTTRVRAVMTTPPGWYPDPSGAPGKRYFDGINWSEHRTAEAPRPAGRKTALWVMLAVGAVCVAFAVVLVVRAVSKDSDPNVTHTDHYSLGQHVSDGQFDFVVSSVQAADHWYGVAAAAG
jgi:hypothetical protein